jgi:hypothetical protein
VEVCPLSRKVMSPIGSTFISPITGEPSLSPRSCTHTFVGFPCGLLSLMGKIWAYHVLFQCLSGLGHPFPPGACVFTTGERATPVPAPFPFWASLSASLACSTLRRLAGFRMCCPYHPILAPHRFDASSDIVLSRVRYQPFGCGFIVPEASHHRVTTVACPGRILLVKQQVSLRLAPLRQPLKQLHVARSP